MLVAWVAGSGGAGGAGCCAAGARSGGEAGCCAPGTGGGTGGGGADCSPVAGGGGVASWATQGPIIPKLVTETASRLAAIILRVPGIRFVCGYLFIVGTV
jgi:hypothetical protein